MSDKKIFGQLLVNTESNTDAVVELEVNDGGDVFLRTENHPDRGGTGIPGHVLALTNDGSVDYITPPTANSVVVSSGSVDQGKVAELDADGKLDPSFITKDKIQTKFLNSSVSTNQQIPDLEFSNLVIGKSYQIKGIVSFSSTVDGPISLEVRNGPTTITDRWVAKFGVDPGTAAGDSITAQQSQFAFDTGEFIATDTIITVVSNFMSAGDFILGTGNYFATWLQIREYANNAEVVTTF